MDGFLARFYHYNWAMLKLDVVRLFSGFFVIGIMPMGVNDTAIVIIPKVPQPKDINDFHPISLCNVVYKIVSKCMVNRLRPLMMDLISKNQSAFIPCRLISDNSIFVFE